MKQDTQAGAIYRTDPTGRVQPIQDDEDYAWYQGWSGFGILMVCVAIIAALPWLTGLNN